MKALRIFLLGPRTLSFPAAMIDNEAAAPLVIHLFGPFELQVNGRPVLGLRSRKGQWLLALLALRAGREVERDWLAGTLWPDSSEAAARVSLRGSLKELRQALAPAAHRLIAPTPRTLCLALPSEAVDVLAFDAAVRQGDALALERAVELYRGPLLEGCCEEWAFQERQVREQAYLSALEALAALALAAGDLPAAERHLRRAAAVDPVRETTQRTLMQVLAAGGNYAAAMQAYRDLRLRLHREMSAAPDPETTALYQRLRAEARTRSAGTPGAPAPPAAGAWDLPAAPVTDRPRAPLLPEGTLTFLFTDIEGSVKRWEEQPEAMRSSLARHDALLRQAIEANEGVVFKRVGDAFCAAFATAAEAQAAALAGQRALQHEAWGDTGPLRVRMALHTGAVEEREGEYFGPPLNRIARLLEAGHGDQILLSLAAQELARDALPEGASLRDLGEHRLKDLIRPERVFQLIAPDLRAEFPPLRSLDTHPHNLPTQPNPLLGREGELRAVQELLRREEVRLVTLTGPGGTGKTRLGMQAAADRLPDFADGVFFVALAPISDPGLVVSAVAQTLGVRETSDRPLLESLQEYLKQKRLLLLLDNFEQVLEAVPLVAALLASCPRLKVLTTSRAALHLRGEHEFPVPPLTLPNPKHLPPVEGLSQYGAVELFIQRALAVKPDFSVTNENAPAVAAICHRLDGLPLAIELAAARIRLLPPEALLARLGSRLQFLTGGPRDLPARQQTLRSAIAWSYDLLDERERTLFRRLAVFAGGCTLDAAEAACRPVGGGQWIVDSSGTSSGADEATPLTAGLTTTHYPLTTVVLDGLAALVDKNLLRQDEIEGEPRFSMLETIREYAQEQLEVSGEAEEVRRRHAALFLTLVETAEPELQQAEATAWMERLEREHDNLRAALAWSGEEAARNEIGLRLCGALTWFWYVRGHFCEGRGWLEKLLARDQDQSPTMGRARALSGAGMLAWVQGEYTTARPRMEQGVALWRELGDRRGLAYALVDLGMMSVYDGHADAAHSLAAECVVLFRELGDPGGVAKSLVVLGRAERARGEVDAARARFEESLAIARQSGHQWNKAMALSNLGNLAQARTDWPAARALIEESVSLWREVSEKQELAYSLLYLGSIAIECGDAAAARARLEEGLAITRDLGDRFCLSVCSQRSGVLAQEQGDYEKARSFYQQSLALGEALNNPGLIAGTLDHLGHLAVVQGDDRTARTVLERSLKMKRERGDTFGLPWTLALLAEATGLRGDSEGGARQVPSPAAVGHATADLLEESLSLWRERGDRWGMAWALRAQGQAALRQASWAAARSCFAESLAFWRDRGNPWRIADCLEGLAQAASGAEQWERAARLFAAAQAQRHVLGALLPPVHAPGHERHFTAVGAAMGEAAFTAALAAGRALPVDEAVALALEETGSD